MPVKGIFAAVLLSRKEDGSLEEEALQSQLEFLIANGIRNFAVNGATSEYCQTTPAELKRCLQIATEVLPAHTSILCGVGAACLRDTLVLGQIAGEAGVRGLLVPPPFFFPYTQTDVFAFAEAVATRLPVPQLLYHLPQFTSGFETGTTLDLVRRFNNIIGIKDSSGSLETLRALAREQATASKVVGNDGVLAQGLAEGICDGVVSGVAAVVPELVRALFAHPPASPAFVIAAEHLKMFISHIEMLPTPWGLKAIAEERAIAPAVYPLPVSPQRVQQIRELRAWFREWEPGLGDLPCEAQVP
jgi:4-hydroxy-tetrahydrodipicolinate synthase